MTTSPPALPVSSVPLLVRTAFDDDAAWGSVLDGVATPSEDEFLATVAVVDDAAYRDLPIERLRSLLPAGEYVTFFFVADAQAQAGVDHPLLVVPVRQPKSPFLDEPPRAPFRVAVTSLWSVENNLSIANMDWADYATAVDHDGVFRGF